MRSCSPPESAAPRCRASWAGPRGRASWRRPRGRASWTSPPDDQRSMSRTSRLRPTAPLQLPWLPRSPRPPRLPRSTSRAPARRSARSSAPQWPPRPPRHARFAGPAGSARSAVPASRRFPARAQRQSSRRMCSLGPPWAAALSSNVNGSRPTLTQHCRSEPRPTPVWDSPVKCESIASIVHDVRRLHHRLHSPSALDPILAVRSSGHRPDRAPQAEPAVLACALTCTTLSPCTGPASTSRSSVMVRG